MKAKRRNRPVEPWMITRIEAGIRQLHQARDNLRFSGANNAANYVARAKKSALGALNNAERMLAKQEREKPQTVICGYCDAPGDAGKSCAYCK